MIQAPPIDLTYDAILDLMPHAINGWVAVDTEVEGKGISVAFRMPWGVIAEYFPIRHEIPEKNLNLIQTLRLHAIFANSTLIFHNAPYDLQVLENNGYNHDGRFYCTMLMEHWLNENLKYSGGYSLDACSRRHGGNPKNRPPEMQFIIDTDGWDAVPLSLMTIYSANDAEITYELFEKLIGKFRAEGFDSDIWHVHEREFIHVIRHMVQIGIRVDPEFCVREILRGQSIMLDCIRQIGFNPGKRNELERLLFDEFKLPVLKRSAKTGKPSLTKAVLEQYDKELEKSDDPRAKVVLRWRGWQKTISANYQSYLKLMDENEILHANINLHRTVTARLSIDNPALHQIPRESEQDWNGSLKKAFISRERYRLWEVDYSQLEFRLAAAYSEDDQLLKIFGDDQRDIFNEMSDTIGWTRDRVKTFTYATLFGGGARHFSDVFRITIPEAKDLIDDYYSSYPKLRGIIKYAETVAKRRGYSLYWTGRRRHFQFPRDEGHKAFNSIIQGGAFEIVKRRMNALARDVCDPVECRMVLQIHDAVVFEILDGMEDNYLPRIRYTMENVEEDQDFGVKFKVSIHEWGKKK